MNRINKRQNHCHCQWWELIMPDQRLDRNGERSRDPVRCKLYDARGLAFRLQRQHVMDQVVHLHQKETPPPFSYLLSDQEPGLLINTVFGNLPLGACLAYQLQDYGRPNTTFFTNYSWGTTPQDISVPKRLEFPDIYSTCWCGTLWFKWNSSFRPNWFHWLFCWSCIYWLKGSSCFREKNCLAGWICWMAWPTQLQTHCLQFC